MNPKTTFLFIVIVIFFLAFDSTLARPSSRHRRNKIKEKTRNNTSTNNDESLTDSNLGSQSQSSNSKPSDVSLANMGPESLTTGESHSILKSSRKAKKSRRKKKRKNHNHHHKRKSHRRRQKNNHQARNSTETIIPVDVDGLGPEEVDTNDRDSKQLFPMGKSENHTTRRRRKSKRHHRQLNRQLRAHEKVNKRISSSVHE